MSDETKPLSQSRTAWGAVAMLASLVLQRYQVSADAGEIEKNIGDVVTAVQLLSGTGGFFLVLWGRIRASKKISR